jgi:hypothetical protein
MACFHRWQSQIRFFDRPLGPPPLCTFYPPFIHLFPGIRASPNGNSKEPLTILLLDGSAVEQTFQPGTATTPRRFPASKNAPCLNVPVQTHLLNKCRSPKPVGKFFTLNNRLRKAKTVLRNAVSFKGWKNGPLGPCSGVRTEGFSPGGRENLSGVNSARAEC